MEICGNDATNTPAIQMVRHGPCRCAVPLQQLANIRVVCDSPIACVLSQLLPLRIVGTSHLCDGNSCLLSGVRYALWTMNSWICRNLIFLGIRLGLLSILSHSLSSNGRSRSVSHLRRSGSRESTVCVLRDAANQRTRCLPRPIT